MQVTNWLLLPVHSDLPIGSKCVSESNSCLTDDLVFDDCVPEEDVSMEIFERDSDVLSSVVLDRLTDTTDAEVVVVRPVGPDMPLSLLDDAERPDGSGMCRLDTGGVSPVDALEWIRIKGLLLPTLSVELAAATMYSVESVVSIGSGVRLETTVLGSGKGSAATDDVFETEDGVLLIVLLVREVVLGVFDNEPSRGRHKPPLPLLRARSIALAAA